MAAASAGVAAVIAAVIAAVALAGVDATAVGLILDGASLAILDEASRALFLEPYSQSAARCGHALSRGQASLEGLGNLLRVNHPLAR